MATSGTEDRPEDPIGTEDTAGTKPEPEPAADAADGADAKSGTDGKGYRHVNFFRAVLIKLGGPAELGDHGPLAGTKYDSRRHEAKDRRGWSGRRARAVERSAASGGHAGPVTADDPVEIVSVGRPADRRGEPTD